ncbi:glycosidase [Patescibacteria group bacterium]|nr:glycosidase [Patescibacteria group bacterium]
MLKLKRYKNNLILKPDPKNWWEKAAVFNCAAWYDGKLIHLLYRAIGEYVRYTSRLGYAVSKDGFHFLKTSNLPVFEPKENYEKEACEDPRLMFLEGKLYMTYVAHFRHPREGKEPAHTALALIENQSFKEFERLGIITPKGSDNRDVVLFSEKIDKKFVMLHRPFRWTRKWLKEMKTSEEKPWLPCLIRDLPEKPSIWIASSSNLKEWTGYKIVMEPKEKWESSKIGVGPPPIRISEGWILIYHGVDENKVYRAGIALLDLQDPSRVIARLPYPVLEPEEEYEKKGDVPDVVFPEGTIVKDGMLFVYYGGADKVCCLATVKISDLLEELKKFNIKN